MADLVVWLWTAAIVMVAFEQLAVAGGLVAAALALLEWGPR
jgi:hypothetical protein